MQKYNKIKNIYTFTNKTPELNEYYDFFKELKFNVTEKVDGTNIRIIWDGYNISFGGRTEKSDLPKHLLEYLNKTFNTPEMENKLEAMFGDKEVIIFGEGYGYKIQENGYFKENKVSFIAFDVMVNEVYLTEESFISVIDELGIERVPVLGQMTLSDALNYVGKGPYSIVSEYDEKIMEGVVCKPLIPLYDSEGKRIVFKVKYGDILKTK